jgi:L-aspartate oxidase
MLPDAIPTVLEPSNYYSLLDRHHGHQHGKHAHKVSS